MRGLLDPAGDRRAVGLMFVPSDPLVAAHLATAISRHRDDLRRTRTHVPAELVQLEETCRIWAKQGAQGKTLDSLADVVDAADMRRLLTTEQVATALAVAPRTVKTLISDGALASVKVGGARRVHIDALDRYLADLGACT